MTAPDPIIVRIVEPSELSGLADVLLGAIGLTGILTLLAVASGVIVAALLYWWRSRTE